jgi:hypothetical protein
MCINTWKVQTRRKYFLAWWLHANDGEIHLAIEDVPHLAS